MSAGVGHMTRPCCEAFSCCALRHHDSTLPRRTDGGKQTVRGRRVIMTTGVLAPIDEKLGVSVDLSQLVDQPFDDRETLVPERRVARVKTKR